MSVETEDTVECLEPERIRQTPQQFLGTSIGNDVRGDFAREAGPGMQRKTGVAASSRLATRSSQCWPDGSATRTVLDGPCK
jgi:hypothetical protein